ncbi:uncharacterized protein LOC127737546 [Mytilus californianus]|uniref:uncharacterized protein LOC127737546 n=1 Tax=Mytilus californianus TaxID=6549 RepID=UPI00224732E5|nr:uncharacterized protein LOC127737546 [Mytilus californianus]
MVDELKPSEIRYCQSSIRPIFFNGDQIGETLDEILEDELDVDDIRTIKVCRKGSRWYTLDNRRLWVFRKAEQFGKCDVIEVEETDDIEERKFTTECRGKFVEVRGDPGGTYWKKNLHKMNTVKKKCVCLSQLRYSRKIIRGSPGYELDTLLKGGADISDVPALPVVQYLPEDKDEDSRYYVLRNLSKLWILKKAEKLGLIEDDLDVDVKIKDIIHEEEELFEHLFDIRSGKRIYNEADLGGKLWKKKLRPTERKDELTSLFGNLNLNY